MRRLALGILLLAAIPAVAQDLKSGPFDLPYKNTYVKNIFVAENPYRSMKRETLQPKSFKEAQKILPAPVWEGHEKEIEMYWHAWQIAVGNIRQPQEGSGFVSPYLDVAYNGNIFMWDDSFMMMFARYGYRFFPFQRTLDNFYAKQHQDGFICREIRADGSDCFERYDPTSTGPNLLPWAELLYYKQFGDIDRLHRVFPALVAYAQWWKLNRTWKDGTYWSSGWGTGMDNMPRVPEGYNQIFSNGHMTWLDTNLQQYLVNDCLMQIGFYIERWQEIEEMEDEMKSLKAWINENMWDEETGYLYDVWGDGSRNATKGISAFWALKTDVLEKDRLDRIVAHLNNDAEFNRTHRVPSLSADHPKYNPKGLRYTYHEGDFMSVGEVIATNPKTRGIVPVLSTDAKLREDHFGFTFKGLMKIEQEGVYQLSMGTDDGSKLWIDGELFFDVDRDGGGFRESWIKLEAGYHRLEIQYFENYGGETIEIGLVGPGIDVENLPAEMLFYE